MKNENYNCSITANITPEEAFKGICKVTEWWSKNTDGETEKLNDVFAYRPNDTWVTFKITECIPDKKLFGMLPTAICIFKIIKPNGTTQMLFLRLQRMEIQHK